MSMKGSPYWDMAGDAGYTGDEREQMAQAIAADHKRQLENAELERAFEEEMTKMDKSDDTSSELTPEALRRISAYLRGTDGRQIHDLTEANNLDALADAWEADRDRARKLTAGLEVYAAKDERIGEVTVFGERADGGEWEYDYDLSADSIFQCVDNKGWMIAHEVLAATSEDKDGEYRQVG